MLAIIIPGFKDLELDYALIDFNGTLATDGTLIDGVAGKLNALSELLEIHIITGDGMGTAKDQLADIHCKLTITPSENQGLTKQNKTIFTRNLIRKEPCQSAMVKMIPSY